MKPPSIGTIISVPSFKPWCFCSGKLILNATRLAGGQQESLCVLVLVMISCIGLGLHSFCEAKWKCSSPAQNSHCSQNSECHTVGGSGQRQQDCDGKQVSAWGSEVWGLNAADILCCTNQSDLGAVSVCTEHQIIPEHRSEAYGLAQYPNFCLPLLLLWGK